MIRLVKASFYQMRRQKMFLGFSITSALLAIVYAVFLNLFINEQSVHLLTMVGMGESDVESLVSGMDGFRYLTACLSFGEYFCIMLAIYITLMVSAEYKSGVLKNMFSRGITKRQFYVSRMIVCGLQSMILFAVFVFMSLVSAVVMWGVTPLSLDEVIHIIVALIVAFLFVFVIGDFLFLIASYIQNTVFAMAGNISMMLLVSSGIQLLTDLVGNVLPLSSFWIVSVLMKYSNLAFTKIDVLVSLAVAIVYLLLIYFAGYSNLKKRQI